MQVSLLRPGFSPTEKTGKVCRAQELVADGLPERRGLLDAEGRNESSERGKGLTSVICMYTYIYVYVYIYICMSINTDGSGVCIYILGCPQIPR